MHNKQKIVFGIASVLFLLASWFIYDIYAAEAILSLEVTGLGIRHGTPENLSLWTITSSLNDQYINSQFTEPFWIEDLQWYITGHYTTIQCDGVYHQNGYKLTWVELMAGNITPELIMWITSPNVKINTTLLNYTNIINPITYLYKETNISNLGIVNKYWDKPRLKISIPSTTPPGIYSGTIVFSFYME